MCVVIGCFGISGLQIRMVMAASRLLGAAAACVMSGGTCSSYRHDRSRQLSVQRMLRGRLASPLGAMESLATLGAFVWVAPRVWPRVGGALDGTCSDWERCTMRKTWVIGEVLSSLEKKLGRPMEVEALLGLIEVAHKAAEVSWRVEGGTTGARAFGGLRGEETPG